MTIRFNTRYRLTILVNKNVLMQFYNSNVNYNIDFESNITKEAVSQGNCRSNTFIYNLSADKRNLLESLIYQGRTESMQIMIEASLNYNETNYHIISYDDIIGIYNEIGEGDYKTNIISKSGEGQIVSSYSSASYPAGTKLSDVIAQESQKMIDGNSVTGYSTTGILDYIFPSGVSFSGNLCNNLKKLCYESNNTFFIDKGIITATQNKWLDNASLPSKSLNFSNGLLEEPHIGQLNYPRRKNKNQGFVGFQFKSLLLPDLSINQVVNVLGVNYTVKRINHTIMTRSGIGFSVIEGFKNDSI